MNSVRTTMVSLSRWRGAGAGWGQCSEFLLRPYLPWLPPSPGPSVLGAVSVSFGCWQLRKCAWA